MLFDFECADCAVINQSGVDAGEYARQLMRNAKAKAGQSACPDCMEVLQEAYSKTEVPGSCTACIVSLHGEVSGCHCNEVFCLCPNKSTSPPILSHFSSYCGDSHSVCGRLVGSCVQPWR
jgi:hypothetical protein